MAAIDTFTWFTQVQNGGATASTVNNDREVAFGNGYRQRASSGFNSVRREFSIVYVGKDWQEVYDFLNNHRVKPFIWTPPDGRIGLFTVQSDSVGYTTLYRDLCEVKCNFSEAFTSMK